MINAYLKMYKSFITQKNKTSKDIITKSLDAFDSIMKIFQQLSVSPSYELKNTLKTVI